ncbi:unnamed protein product [Vitrella brassicaformis CCMP3155]|uniref:Protein kinase domain-containing protein n=1 Tax=Vitrella brassicaformis (strain CCMP3155) TaxID=1169540 RepID=A0A0G4ELE1_VITBC|nr:unnamed protein product [Vitrella brassicaformis CCMP3155]|eukprot:CEL97824.1 unnamed protein product [Vitrella brassicaformis CCMP3155]
MSSNDPEEFFLAIIDHPPRETIEESMMYSTEIPAINLPILACEFGLTNQALSIAAAMSVGAPSKAPFHEKDKGDAARETLSGFGVQSDHAAAMRAFRRWHDIHVESELRLRESVAEEPASPPLPEPPITPSSPPPAPAPAPVPTSLASVDSTTPRLRLAADMVFEGAKRLSGGRGDFDVLAEVLRQDGTIRGVDAILKHVATSAEKTSERVGEEGRATVLQLNRRRKWEGARLQEAAREDTKPQLRYNAACGLLTRDGTRRADPRVLALVPDAAVLRPQVVLEGDAVVMEKIEDGTSVYDYAADPGQRHPVLDAVIGVNTAEQMLALRARGLSHNDMHWLNVLMRGRMGEVALSTWSAVHARQSDAEQPTFPTSTAYDYCCLAWILLLLALPITDAANDLLKEAENDLRAVAQKCGARAGTSSELVAEYKAAMQKAYRAAMQCTPPSPISGPALEFFLKVVVFGQICSEGGRSRRPGTSARKRVQRYGSC